MDAKLKAKALTEDELNNVAGGIVYDRNGELAAAFKENPYLSLLQENCRLPPNLKVRLRLLGVDAERGDSEKDSIYTIENDNHYFYTYKEVCHYIRYLSPEIIDEKLSKRGW